MRHSNVIQIPDSIGVYSTNISGSPLSTVCPSSASDGRAPRPLSGRWCDRAAALPLPVEDGEPQQTATNARADTAPCTVSPGVCGNISYKYLPAKSLISFAQEMYSDPQKIPLRDLR